MISLILSILSSTIILLIFKLSERIKIDVFSIIVINYLAATLLGFFLNNLELNSLNFTKSNWIFLAAAIGILFIIMFFIIGLSTQKAGIGVTSIASKMSVVVPMLFSIIIYNEILTGIKITGIIIALLAVFLSVYKKRNESTDFKSIYLPVVLFLGMGIIDSLVKYSQAEYIHNDLLPLFTSSTFLMAFISGVILTIFRQISIKKFFNKKSIVFGTLLGAANWGSMYFMIKALNTDFLDSSVIFALNNIGIITISLLLGIILFSERINRINWIGIGCSFIAILILSFT